MIGFRTYNHPKGHSKISIRKGHLNNLKLFWISFKNSFPEGLKLSPKFCTLDADFIVKKSIKIFPNLLRKNKLYIQSETDKKVEVQIFNPQGELIMKNNNFTIFENSKNLKSWLYIFQVIFQNKITQQKVFIQ